MTTAGRTLRIGELAKRAGVPAKTIRYYEEIGLLPKPPRTEAGYRLYGRETAGLLRFIRKAQGLGLSLADIRELAEIRSAGGLPCEHLRAMLERKVAELEERVREMRRLRDEMRRMLKDWDGQVENGRTSVVCPHIEARDAGGPSGAPRAKAAGTRVKRPRQGRAA